MNERDIDCLKTCFTEQNENHCNVFQELRKREIDSLRKGQFTQAEQAKNKFNKLKEEQIRIRQELVSSKNKENIKEVAKQAEQNIVEFQKEWQLKLRLHIEQAKRHQEILQLQHDQQLQEFKEKLVSEDVPKVKYSSQVLTMRRNLQNLIKVRDYMEAENTRNMLLDAEQSQAELWRCRIEEKKKHKYEQILRRQQNEFKALRIKLETQFNEKIKEREVKFHILLKKNQKKKIEQAKLNQTSTLELSRDLSRTLSTINRPIHINRALSKSTEKKMNLTSKAWFK